MVNTVNIIEPTAVKTAYNKRNMVYLNYIEDIVYRSFIKLIKREDVDKILLNPVNIDPSNYKDTISLAVITKYKGIKDLLEAENKDVIFTLEPKDPALLETNVDVLEKAYTVKGDGALSVITPVTKELSTLVSTVTFDILDFVKNRVGNFLTDYTANVKVIVNDVQTDTDDKMDLILLDVNTIDNIITENGIISKKYNGNMRYSLDVSFDASNLVNAILDTDYANIDLNKFDMEIDSEFHKYLGELDSPDIDGYKEKVKEIAGLNLTVKGFLRELTDLKVANLKDTKLLVYTWVAAINEYIKSNSEEFANIAGYIEELIYNNVNAIERYQNNDILALGRRINDKIEIVVLVKPYVNMLETYKNLTNIIKGYFTNAGNELMILKTTSINKDNIDTYIERYNKYLANLRYQMILSRVQVLRDAYVLGFVKSNKEFLSLVNGNYDLYENTLKLVKELVLTYKIDKLLDVDNTVYDIAKKVLFTDLVSTIESFINLGEKRFPNSEDDAIVFATILTLVETVFSLFNVKILSPEE